MRSPHTVWSSLLSLFLVFVPRAMGISDGLSGGYSVDSSVGTIVWVRRRNGSWWPGRILGPNELSASHLMSPRSGTPVKLLGREDASVDWYNLEKSKRVKAFRCGEFDACIERAEASQGIPIKKREKYARREDAILHALELEKQQLEMKQKKLVSVSTGITNKTTGVPKIELNNFSSEVYVRNNDPGVPSKYVNHKYQTVSRKAIFPHEDDNISNSLYVHKGINGKQFNWEGDIPEALPRMKGLQEFGLLSAPSKRTLTQSVPWETIPKPADNHVDALSSAGHIIGDAVHTGSCKSSMSIKLKRSQDGMVEDSLFRKHERRRPLVHVLQSSRKTSHSFQSDYDAGLSMQDEKDLMGVVCRAKRSRCIYVPPDSNESLDHSGYPYEEMATDDYLHHSASLADEYISSEPDSSERVFWEYDMKAANLLTDSGLTLVPGSEDCNTYRFQIPDEFENMNNDKLPITSYMHQLHPHEQTEDVSAEVGVSRWHMKGKRNSRNLAKRPINAMDRKIFNSADKYNGSAKGTRHRSMGNSFKIGQKFPNAGFYHKKEFNHVSDVGDLGDKNLGHTHFTGYNNRKNPFPVQAAKDHGRSHSSFNDSDSDSLLISRSGREADGPSHAARGSYWEESDECFEPAYAGCIDDETEPMLVDVDLKAKASYQGEHVPLVSLMSRLNGKAIIGHPVQIEILEDGYSGAVLSRKITGLDESTEPPPVWRTARRTAMQRVPRSNPVTSALEGEDAEPLQYSDCESKLRFTKLYSGHFSRQAKLVKKSISHACRLVSGKSHKKHVKRSLLSSQKTRMLSSIETDRKLRRENMDAKLSRRGDILGRLIKSEAAMPLVTCVPVKVVFSRIMEAVGRPSAAAAHRVLMTSPVVRDSS